MTEQWFATFEEDGDCDSGDQKPHYPVWVGFICAGVAIIFFGSNFIPVKKIESGDGMFFQWVLCSAIWWCGLVVHILRGCPTFHLLAMLGGFLWATGNVLTVPILKTIGLGQGILVWASVNMIAGWASSRFGWFGVDAQIPHNIVLNYVGVGLCLVSGVVFLFIKSDSQTRVEQSTVAPSGEEGLGDVDQDPLLPPPSMQNEQVQVPVTDATFLDRMSPVQKRIFGSIAAVVAGVFYGLNFQPVFYIMDNPPPGQTVSCNVLDYVFAHFCGIYATSCVYFLVYCSYMQSRPRLYPRIVLPGLVSGVMWAAADICWFIANSALSEPVAFPIITTGPAIVGALWGVWLFREIKGLRNYLLLVLAACVVVVGSVLTGLSRIDHHHSNTTTTTSTTTTTTSAATTTATL